MIRLDGSHGEGGGQILRTALALSALTGEKLLVVRIRSGRPNPGLRAQHLAGVRAMQGICGAKVRGAQIGSPELMFEPGPVAGGDWRLDVGTAGSTSLVLQALLPALSFAERESRLTIRGGTHVAWSPPFHHLSDVFLPQVRRMGVKAEMALNRWGWYPKGEGEIEAGVEPVSGTLKPLVLEGAFSPQEIEILSATSNLPSHVRERVGERLLARLSERGLKATLSLLDVPAANPGCLAYLRARDGEKLAATSALGEKGKPAEAVADEAVEEFFHFLDGGGAVDEHLADQLVPYLALAEGESRFTTSRLSRHLLTNIWVIESFTEHIFGKIFEVEGELGEPGRVVVKGVGFRRFSG